MDILFRNTVLFVRQSLEKSNLSVISEVLDVVSLGSSVLIVCPDAICVLMYPKHNIYFLTGGLVLSKCFYCLGIIVNG